MPPLPKRRKTLRSGSEAIGKVKPRSFRKGTISSAFCSRAMATIWKSGDVLYLRQTSRSSRGISTRHGGHQVAQKLTSTTLPFRSSIFDCLPSSDVKSKDGIGWPVCVYDSIASPGPAGVCVAAAFGQRQSSSSEKQIASFMFIFPFSLNSADSVALVLCNLSFKSDELPLASA